MFQILIIITNQYRLVQQDKQIIILWEVTDFILTCIISLILLAFFSRDGKSKKYMYYCTISTFSWKIYIWKVKAVSNCNQLILIISHLLNAISPLLGEVFKTFFDHWNKLSSSSLIYCAQLNPKTCSSTFILK